MASPLAIKLEQKRREEKARYEGSLKEFTQAAWHLLEPGIALKWNWHLDVLCAYLEAWYDGKIKNLIFNIPPGTMKSLLVSVFAPAWQWTRRQDERYINLTNELGLATRDAVRMRALVQSDWYQKYWYDKVQLSSEQREKTHFSNTRMGFRQGIGFGGNITGKRGTKLLIDDPIDAKKAFSDIEIQTVNDTYDQVVSSRLSDPVEDGKCLIMQRLRTNDLTGHLLSKKKQHWTHVSIAMRYEGEDGYDPVKDLGPEYEHLRDPRTKEGELLWADRFPEEVVLALEEDLGEFGTSGQLQQRPSPMGGGIIKKKWWKVWGKEKWTVGLQVPLMRHVVCSWDTAFSEKDMKASAFSACTVWGIFEMDSKPGQYAMMLLDKWVGRVGYADLRPKAIALAKKHLNYAYGDAVLIERKASGISLIQDLRRHRRIRVRGYDPKGDGDKVARAYMASPYVQAGLVWLPDRKWAQEMVDIVSEFPAGGPPCADLTDTITQAIQYVKRREWVRHPDDAAAEEEDFEHGDNKVVSAYG